MLTKPAVDKKAGASTEPTFVTKARTFVVAGLHSAARRIDPS